MVITDTLGGGAAVFFSSVHPARWNALINIARIKINLPFTLPPLLVSVYANPYRFYLEPISKIVDHVQEQGVGRRKSAAYK
jgi:hypothetical protein